VCDVIMRLVQESDAVWLGDLCVWCYNASCSGVRRSMAGRPVCVML